MVDTKKFLSTIFITVLYGVVWAVFISLFTNLVWWHLLIAGLSCYFLFEEVKQILMKYIILKGGK